MSAARLLPVATILADLDEPARTKDFSARVALRC
jgi:hypothetical protein